MHTTQTAGFPVATPVGEHARCGHGLGDLTGYVVAYTRVTPGGVTREDFAWVQDAYQYAYALELAYEARARIAAGEIDATYAVIDHVYEGDHRML